MTGGAGDDTYVVDNAGDTVTEERGRGHRHGAELGQPTRSAANVENLTLTGSAAINGTGNALDQRHHRQLRGDNVLDGGAAPTR